MKKLFSCIIVLLCQLAFSNFSLAQSCCSKDLAFAKLASTKEFLADHPAPLPFSYTPASNGSMIVFRTQDGKDGRAYYLPSDKPTTKALIIFHEWWGLNDYIKREAERWQKMLGNVDVYAVDLYDGKIATTPEEARTLVTSLDAKRAETIISALLTTVGKDMEIATLGWCMGGSWAFTAGVMAEERTRGIVMYYGFPEKEPKRIKPLKADVLYVWGTQDEGIKKNVVEHLQREVEASGNKFFLHSFNADHAFANPSNPKHDAARAEEAEQLALNFIKQKLRLE